MNRVVSIIGRFLKPNFPKLFLFFLLLCAWLLMPYAAAFGAPFPLLFTPVSLFLHYFLVPGPFWQSALRVVYAYLLACLIAVVGARLLIPKQPAGSS